MSPEGVLSVLDNGPGIPADDRPHIFDRFWRGRAVRTNGAELGLAIVMEIAKAHGASIAVTDRSPQGARFDLQFRRASLPLYHLASITDPDGSAGTVTKLAGSSPVRLSRNATMSCVSASFKVTPSCTRAMTVTASGRVATDPSWK